MPDKLSSPIFSKNEDSFIDSLLHEKPPPTQLPRLSTTIYGIYIKSLYFFSDPVSQWYQLRLKIRTVKHETKSYPLRWFSARTRFHKAESRAICRRVCVRSSGKRKLLAEIWPIEFLTCCITTCWESTINPNVNERGEKSRPKWIETTASQACKNGERNNGTPARPARV